MILTLWLVATAPALWAEQFGSPDQVQEAAEQGNTDAQMELGSYYELGYGRPRDHVKALAWYWVAASKGHYLAAKRAVMLESRLTAAEVEAARKLSEQLAQKKAPAP